VFNYNKNPNCFKKLHLNIIKVILDNEKNNNSYKCIKLLRHGNDFSDDFSFYIFIKTVHINLRNTLQIIYRIELNFSNRSGLFVDIYTSCNRNISINVFSHNSSHVSVDDYIITHDLNVLNINNINFILVIYDILTNVLIIYINNKIVFIGYGPVFKYANILSTEICVLNIDAETNRLKVIELLFRNNKNEQHWLNYLEKQKYELYDNLPIILSSNLHDRIDHNKQR
jgi:hypothetical protein